MKTIWNAALLLALVSGTAQAQVNAGSKQPEASLPFTMTQVATFNLPWRIAFLPDGRMLDHREGRPGLARDAAGREDAGRERAGGPAPGSGRHAGRVRVAATTRPTTTSTSPIRSRATADRASRWRARELAIGEGTASLEGLEVIWRQMPKGRGGQFGAAIAFSPDGQYLFLTVGDRQRMTPAQDPDQALGKILRLTLDGKPAPGNPMAGKTGAASVPLINPPRDTEAGQDGAGRQHLHVPGTEPGAGGDVDHRTSHAVRPGVRARRPAVGSRARPARRRRAEPDRARQELRLAARVVRDELQRRADPEPGHAARSDQAGDLLDAGHRAGQPHVLQRRDVPAVEGLGADRRHGDADAQPHHVRRQGRRRRPPSAGMSATASATSRLLRMARCG